MEAVAADRLALAPLRRHRVRGRGGRDRGVERGVEAGHRGHVRAAPRGTASSASSDFGWCSGASAVSVGQRAPHVVVDHDRVAERGAAVHDPVPDRVRARGQSPRVRPPDRRPGVGCPRSAPRQSSPRRAAAASGCSSPALTTRTLTASARPGPVAHRRARPRRARGCRPVRAGRASAICWRSARPPLAEAGHPVDDVHDQVEPVQVVEHHHVERRGGGALLLVAAHVQVVVVASAGRSAGGSATGSRGRRR